MNVSLRLAICIDGIPRTWLDIPTKHLEGKTDDEKNILLGEAMTELSMKTEAYMQSISKAQQPTIVAPAKEIIIP